MKKRSVVSFVSIYLLHSVFLLPCGADPLPTGFHGTPAAFSTGDTSTPLVWDRTFAANLGDTGKQYFVFTYCHSGGFINEMTKANRLIYTSNDWDEYGWASTSGDSWGLPFFQKLDDANTSMSSAYLHATSLRMPFQLPRQDDPSGIGANKMTFAAGDKAFLFANSDPAIGTLNSLNAAETSLRNLGWTAANNGGVDPIQKSHGPAANQAALNTIYTASKNMPSDKKLFVYIDDHGASTDIIVDKYTPGHYRYDVTVGLWRGWTTTNQYGITDVRIETGDPDIGNYSNWVLPDGWDKTIETVANEPGDTDLVVHFSTADVTKSLAGDVTYAFGFDHADPPFDVDWSTRSSLFLDDDDKVNDAGIKEGLGIYVYDKAKQWSTAPLYLGDAGVRGPIPEPATLTLLALGGLAVLRRRRR